MKNIEYKKYTKEEMIDIAKNKGFYFVETSNEDYFEIAKDDLVDFIILEAERCGHDVEISVYTPYRENGDPYYNANLDYNSCIPIVK